MYRHEWAKTVVHLDYNGSVPAPVPSSIPAFFSELAARVSNWGRWGPDDQIGTLNLIDHGDSMVLLDWEYAHCADPLWDLAGWSANNDFEDELERDLLASYTGRPPTRDEYLRLQLLGWLYDYVCLLWCELYLNLYRDARPGDAAHGAAPDDATVNGAAARAQQLAARLIATASSRAG